VGGSGARHPGVVGLVAVARMRRGLGGAAACPCERAARASALDQRGSRPRADRRRLRRGRPHPRGRRQPDWAQIAPSRVAVSSRAAHRRSLRCAVVTRGSPCTERVPSPATLREGRRSDQCPIKSSFIADLARRTVVCVCRAHAARREKAATGMAARRKPMPRENSQCPIKCRESRRCPTSGSHEERATADRGAAGRSARSQRHSERRPRRDRTICAQSSCCQSDRRPTSWRHGEEATPDRDPVPHPRRCATRSGTEARRAEDARRASAARTAHRPGAGAGDAHHTARDRKPTRQARDGADPPESEPREGAFGCSDRSLLGAAGSPAPDRRGRGRMLAVASDAGSLGAHRQGAQPRPRPLFGKGGKVFADRFHDRVLTSPKQVRHALAYVLCNARKHAVAPPIRGGTGSSWVDPCSSARAFDGWSREVSSSNASSPRQPPQTPRVWLLRIGWRRGGLLHPDHCPGRALH
jgi:hypothetical protein